MNEKKRFSIGEIANLTGVSIRTLQYYDNIGLVPLNKELTNGRRFYDESDLAKLQQVLFYKSLGLPIKEIKDLVIEAVTADQIASVLQKQRQVFYQKLMDIKMNISLIETSIKNLENKKGVFSGELVQLMISLNRDTIFKYKEIHYDDKTEDIFMKYYEDTEEIIEIYWSWKTLILEATMHIFNGVDPKREEGKAFAKKWIKMVTNITKGKLDLLNAHKVAYNNRDQWPEEDRRLMEFTNEFIDKAMEAYLAIDKKGEKYHD
ncbi:MerR family transcriptional regulator [Clostridium sp. D2Q-14]|uniref:MerR family transcriptional regulator n=1 Tax=Anaeromonas gelatinilytica TaxID=2683194 RepID=UPI00193B5967|nr:MerR family transcriptional regulator [Anaeromonas gelatinilytica]MBS4536321.1 MerR family transcriptional regulator [Anaeromonas gelatinilytica]